MSDGAAGCAVEYAWESGDLFLATKKASGAVLSMPQASLKGLGETKTQITINGFDRKRFL